MHGPILCATVVAPDLDEAVAAYSGTLGFEVLGEDRVSTGLAAAWGWPGLAGARSALLGHELDSPGLVRLVESGAHADARPLLRPGWRSIELCVENVQRVRERIEGSAFTVVGEPAPIPGADDIEAMQVVGPAGEMLYLTEIADAGVFDLPQAKRFVERVFIAVMTAPDLAAARTFYEQTFGGHDPAGVFTAPIECVNRVLDLPLETEHSFCAVQLAGQSLVEVDQHPAELIGGAAGEGDTPPPGTALMTFAVDALPAGSSCWSESGSFYQGRATATLTGLAGERIELVQTRERG